MAEGDRVIFRTTFRGTQSGEQFGAAPTGKQMSYVSYSTVRIAEGKIAEEWNLWDRLGFFQQLGLMPDARSVIAQARAARAAARPA